MMKMELKAIYKEIEKYVEKATTEGITREDFYFLKNLRDSLCYYEYEGLSDKDYNFFFNVVCNIIDQTASSKLLHKYSYKELNLISENSSLLTLILADRSDKNLRMQGPNGYMFVCPLHYEKTPSFRVKDFVNGFYCFGCGCGGNVFKYLQKRYNISFTKSADLLLKIFMLQETKEDDKDKDLIYKYQQAITSLEYKELLLMGQERLKKYNMEFMPHSTTPVVDYYADRFKMIERIENGYLEALNLENYFIKRLKLNQENLYKNRNTAEEDNNEKILIDNLESRLELEKPPEKILKLKHGLYINQDDNDDELPF